MQSDEYNAGICRSCGRQLDDEVLNSGCWISWVGHLDSETMAGGAMRALPMKTVTMVTMDGRELIEWVDDGHMVCSRRNFLMRARNHRMTFDETESKCKTSM